jgi:hypothetical protein
LVTADLAENDHLSVKKQNPSSTDNLANTSFAKGKIRPTLQNWTPREDYLDFKLASRRNRKKRLKFANCR